MTTATNTNTVNQPTSPTTQQVSNPSLGIDNDNNVVTVDNGITTEDSYNVAVEDAYNDDHSLEVEVEDGDRNDVDVNSNNGNNRGNSYDYNDDNSVTKNSNNASSVNNASSSSSSSTTEGSHNTTTTTYNINITIIGDDIPTWLALLGLGPDDAISTGGLEHIELRESVFDYAQDHYEHLFHGDQETIEFQGYDARVFDNGQAFGEKDGYVWYYDGNAEGEVVNVGVVEDYAYDALVAGY